MSLDPGCGSYDMFAISQEGPLLVRKLSVFTYSLTKSSGELRASDHYPMFPFYKHGKGGRGPRGRITPEFNYTGMSEQSWNPHPDLSDPKGQTLHFVAAITYLEATYMC